LLEAMEEQQVTVDAQTYELPSPFLVIATQNPVELEGTYPLPEAQLDRFLLRLRIGYPDRDAELAILEAQDTSAVTPEELQPVTDAAAVAGWSRALGRVHVTPELQGYIVDIVEASRHHRDLLLGVSPRGALALQRAARALAAHAEVAANYERKGHRFVDLDVVIVADGIRAVAQVRHTAIYRLRQTA